MTDEQLLEIEQACREATPGPWGILIGERAPGDTDRWLQAGRTADDGSWAPATTNADVDFLSRSRSWVPDLVAEVRKLRGYMAARFFPLSMREGMADPIKAMDKAQEYRKFLQDRAVAARLEEREACAKLADLHFPEDAVTGNMTAHRIASAIRSRGRT